MIKNIDKKSTQKVIHNKSLIFIIIIIILLSIFIFIKFIYEQSFSLDLINFINKYKILSVLLIYVITIQAKNLGDSIVNNLLMPLFQPIFGKKKWSENTKIGIFSFGFGPFISDCIKFFLSLIALFMLYKLFILININMPTP